MVYAKPSSVQTGALADRADATLSQNHGVKFFYGEALATYFCPLIRLSNFFWMFKSKFFIRLRSVLFCLFRIRFQPVSGSLDDFLPVSLIPNLILGTMFFFVSDILSFIINANTFAIGYIPSLLSRIAFGRNLFTTPSLSVSTSYFFTIGPIRLSLSSVNFVSCSCHSVLIVHC